jgi:hypothetical protein
VVAQAREQMGECGDQLAEQTAHDEFAAMRRERRGAA